ncbi:hypothetical protein B0H66DRAFT_613106 [Apodospora peruviana]|uniref:Pre-mRNA-splicing factor 38B n=1 Tax=Apodospora peruviana TaxID=516989 RepID=A0AAE0ITP0_9PEZI|nr:hypothetical protein B0H66DRAFT_613106 [Apodospora peruviana]
MSSDTILTDDYVAGLLATEAGEASIRYSSMGLEAFRPTKPITKAKPNTRFLGRIIKETTNHNAALLAKEAAEAQARLDDLTEAEEKKRRKLRPSPEDIRRRQLGDISSILLGGKRKRRAEAEDHSSTPRNASSSRRKDDDISPGNDRYMKRETRPSEHDKDERERRHTRHHREDAREDRRHRHRHRSRSPGRSSSRRRYRQRSPLSDDKAEEKDDRKYHRSSTKPTKVKSRIGDDLLRDEISKRIQHGRLARDDDDRRKDDSSAISSNKKSSRHHNSSRSTHRSNHGRLADDDGEYSDQDAADSDPLDDLIGPVPPSSSSVRPRGRGAGRGIAMMDSRFSDTYDPKSDPEAIAEGTPDDWDEAVEAFRDRQKWKQQGADRLRSAGFTEEQIGKWEKQGVNGEKDLDDVTWSKKGERREWDRGKDVMED